MGKGNVCVTGKCEGLFYVDNKFLDVYRRKNTETEEYEFTSVDEADETYEYDEIESDFRRGEFTYLMTEAIRSRFPSFDYIDKYISRTRKVLLENKLFYIVCEDNEWSLAVELIQKSDEYSGEELIGLQMGLYEKYLEGIKNILLDINGEVGVRASAYTSGVITKGM